ncbi:response regulator [Azospirillum sp. sgz302134]
MSQARSDDQSTGQITGAGALTVALLEDDGVLCLSNEMALEDHNLRLVSGSSPAALLDALRGVDCRPDIVVADFHLGKREKAPVLVRELLTALGRDLPVIITTGDESSATMAVIREAGWHFLGKPYAPETLHSLILSVLGSRS